VYSQVLFAQKAREVYFLINSFFKPTTMLIRHSLLRLPLCILATLFMCVSINAQPFTLNGGYQSFAAQGGGVPGEPNRTVLVRTVPNATGNVGQLRQLLNNATIPDVVIDSRLTEGVFAGHIAQLPGTISMANALNNRLATRSNINGAIVINSTTALNNNRNSLGNNSVQTYIFRGNVNVGSEIVVGSNKTIWIDGTVTWTGPEIAASAGDQFSPLGQVQAGVFRVIGKDEVTIKGTKRGLIDCKTFVPAVYSFNSTDLIVNDLEVINGYNSIFLRQSFRVEVENNFIYNDSRRGLHILAVGTGTIKNNLVYDSHVDGIDIDAFANNLTVSNNVIVGARFRHMLWTEIDARDNILDNNVGIHLDDAKRGSFAGGFEENGTEQERNPNSPQYDGTSTGYEGNRRNTWTNNNVFYPLSGREGIFMFKDRFIQHLTITFTNNYVWTVRGDIERHNPRPEANLTTDARFLTIQNPVLGSATPRPAPFPPNATAIINNEPSTLPFSAIVSTPNREGGGGGPACSGSSAITGLSATSTSTSVTVSFDELSGVNTYELRTFAAGTFTGNVNGGLLYDSGSGSPITVSGLTPNTAYTFVLRAVCSGGGVTPTSTIDATPGGGGGPSCSGSSTISGLSATTTPTSVTVAFNALSGVNTYELRTYAAGTFTGALSGALQFDAGNTSPITVEGLNPNTQYTFVLRAICSGGGTTPVSTINATTGTNQLIANGTYFIKKASSNHYINAVGNTSELKSSSNTNGNNSRWTFLHLGNDEYRITNVGFNQRMEVPFGNIGQGLKVARTSYTGPENHLIWKALDVGSGDIQFLPKHDQARALDIWSSNPAVVHVWNKDASNGNQRFNLIATAAARGTIDYNLSADVVGGVFEPVVFPNPTVGEVVIKDLREGQLDINVFSVTGTKLLSRSIEVAGRTNLDLSAFKPGIYLVSLIQDGEQRVIRVSKN